MSGRQVIYGSSDDLVELRGDVDEEFPAMSGNVTETGFLALSNGVLVKYDLDDENDGVWVLRPVGAIPEGVTVEVVQARGDGEPHDEDGCAGYSQKVVVVGPTPVTWVLHGSTYAGAKGLVRA